MPGRAAGTRAPPGLRVLMAGPLPPMIGGMTTVIENLSGSDLARAVDYRLFDTKKNTPVDRTLPQAILAKIRLLWKWWRELGDRVSLAHVHTCSGLTYFLDGLLVVLARVRRVPVIIHVHGGRFDAFIDSLHGPLAPLARWVARLAAVVVVLSEEWHTRLQSRLPGATLRVVENGVAIPAEAARPGEPGAVTVAFLANLSAAKGVWDLLAAAEGLPASTRVAMIGGEGESGITSSLSVRIAEKGLEDVVRLCGPLTGADKQDVLCRAQVFALPSYVEALPMALLEAMALGLPPVVAPVGAVPSIVQDGRNGLLVPPGDAAALCAAVTRLIEDPALRARLGATARRDCIERFGMQRTTEMMGRIYEEVLGECLPSPGQSPGHVGTARI